MGFNGKWGVYYLFLLINPFSPYANQHNSTHVTSQIVSKLCVIAWLFAIVYPLETCGLISPKHPVEQRFVPSLWQAGHRDFLSKSLGRKGAEECFAHQVFSIGAATVQGAWDHPHQLGWGAGKQEELGTSEQDFGGESHSSSQLWLPHSKSPERAAVAALALWMRPLKICIYHNTCESQPASVSNAHWEKEPNIPIRAFIPCYFISQ